MRRSTRYAVLVLALLCGAAATVWLARPRTLLERATRVGADRPSSVRDLRRATVLVLPREITGWARSSGLVYGGVLLSLPDGCCLLWPAGCTVPPRRPAKLLRGRWPTSGSFMPAGCHWQPAAACGAGASGWVALVELHDGCHLLRYGVDGPHALTDVPAALYPTQRPAAEPMIFMAGSTYGDFPRVALGVTSRGAGLTAPMFRSLGRDWDCVLFEHHIGDGASGERRIRLQIPHGGVAREIALSDHGDQLAWFVYVPARPWAPRWLRRLLPAKITRGSDSVALWVGRSDGSQQHMVAAEAQPPSADRFEPFGSAPGGLRWTPDGKRVSFLYKDRRYTVPAD